MLEERLILTRCNDPPFGRHEALGVLSVQALIVNI